MLIYATADIHLSSAHEERLNNFITFCQKAVDDKIQHILIAGDLFDKDVDNTTLQDFDNLAQQFQSLTFHIIPGNHDISTDPKFFRNTNIKIYTSPKIEILDNYTFAFVPYQEKQNMAQSLSSLNEELKHRSWTLISHGDYTGNTLSNIGENETGYFPISKADIYFFHPKNIILGHIHQPYSPLNNLLYTGSLYPLNKGETGIRRFLAIDTNTKTIQSKNWITTPIYEKLSLTLFPTNNTEDYLHRKIQDFLNTQAEWVNNLYLFLYLNGYTYNKNELSQIFDNLKKRLSFQGELIDTTNITTKNEFENILKMFEEKIQKLEIIPAISKEEILKAGEDLIYGN